MMSRAALQYFLSPVGAAASSVAGPFELVGAEHINLALSGIHFGVWSGRGHCPEATTAATADDFTTNAFIALGAWKWAEAQSKTGQSPVYRFRFDRPAPPEENHPQGKYAFHSDELEYAFGTLDVRHAAA